MAVVGWVTDEVGLALLTLVALLENNNKHYLKSNGAVGFNIAEVAAATGWCQIFSSTNHSVIVALDTLVEFVGPLAVAVPVALALDGAVGADVAEVAAAHVGLHAGAAHAALRAHGRAAAARRALVPRAARAFVPFR